MKDRFVGILLKFDMALRNTLVMKSTECTGFPQKLAPVQGYSKASSSTECYFSHWELPAYPGLVVCGRIVPELLVTAMTQSVTTPFTVLTQALGKFNILHTQNMEGNTHVFHPRAAWKVKRFPIVTLLLGHLTLCQKVVWLIGNIVCMFKGSNPHIPLHIFCQNYMVPTALEVIGMPAAVLNVMFGTSSSHTSQFRTRPATSALSVVRGMHRTYCMNNFASSMINFTLLRMNDTHNIHIAATSTFSTNSPCFKTFLDSDFLRLPLSRYTPNRRQR